MGGYFFISFFASPSETDTFVLVVPLVVALFTPSVAIFTAVLSLAFTETAIVEVVVIALDFLSCGEKFLFFFLTRKKCYNQKCT